MKTIFEIDLVKLAKWHRVCSITTLVFILGWVGMIFFMMYNAAIPGLGLLGGIFFTVMILTSMVLTGITHRAMGQAYFTSIVWSLTAFLLSFLVLLSTASTAGMILRLAGAKCGTLGVARDDLDRLRPDHCRSCGYSRQGIGLLDLCPECTAVPRVI